MVVNYSPRYIFLASGVLILTLLAPGVVWAHPGRTDSSGGHTCRTNCAKWSLGQEEYHKHNAGGGYTNSKGQTFDKEGNPVGGSSADNAAPSPTPPPAAPQQAQQVAPAPVKTQQAPTPTHVEQGKVMGTAAEASPSLEPSPEEPSPTPTSSPEATPDPTPTPTSEPGDEGGGGAAAATLGTLAVLGGGGYYLWNKLRKKT